MAQNLVPAADSVDGSWTNESGSQTSLYESVNEPEASISDTDYIQSDSPPSADTAKVKLATPTYGPGTGTMRLKLRAKWHTDSASVAFVWDAVVGATSYVLQVRTAASGTYNIFDQDVGDTQDYTMTLYSGRYYSRVVPQGAGSATAEQVTNVP